MAGFNQVILTGKVGKTPQLQYNRASIAHAELQLVCIGVHQNAQEEYIETTEVFCFAFEGSAAEELHQLVAQGDVVLVEGRLKKEKQQLLLVGEKIRLLAKSVDEVASTWPEASQGVAKLNAWEKLTQQGPKN